MRTGDRGTGGREFQAESLSLCKQRGGSNSTGHAVTRMPGAQRPAHLLAEPSYSNFSAVLPTTSPHCRAPGRRERNEMTRATWQLRATGFVPLPKRSTAFLGSRPHPSAFVKAPRTVMAQSDGWGSDPSPSRTGCVCDLGEPPVSSRTHGQGREKGCMSLLASL